MDPLTMVGVAKGIADITGFSDWLGDLIGSKNKAVVNKVINVAQAVTGTNDPKQALSKLHDDPELVADVQERLLEHKEVLYQLALQDKASARAMQKAAMNQTDLKTRRFIYNFAWFWSAIAAAFIFLIVLYPIPQQNIRFADTVLGFVLGTIIATILQFFYGSMLKQQDKHE